MAINTLPNTWKDSDELRVASVSAQFTGTYKCVASNTHGADEAVLNVTAAGKRPV